MSFDLSAVVVAAGRGERFQRGLGINNSRPSLVLSNKVLLSWDGQPLIRRTLDALSVLNLKEIVLVTREEERSTFEEIFASSPYYKSIRWAVGGRRRQDSVREGLRSLSLVQRVLVHDGARPFLAPDFLQSLNQASLDCPAVIPTLPIVETLKEVSSEGFIIRTVKRESFVRVQTPQFFNFEILRDAHERFKDSDVEFTDDAALMEAAGHPVRSVSGHGENVKVTTPEDLRIRGIYV